MSNPMPKRTPIAYFLVKEIAFMTLTITKKINICYVCSWLVITKVNKRTQFQHNYSVKDIYAKTILPIDLVPHLKIFPMKNNIYI